MMSLTTSPIEITPTTLPASSTGRWRKPRADIIAMQPFVETALDVLFALSKGVLSQEDVSGENDEAAHAECRVDANHYPRDPGLEDTCGEQRDTNQCCQRNQ